MNWAIDWAALRPEYLPLFLFGLRAIDLTLATFRLLAVIRGRAWLAWFVGFFEAGIFVLGAAGLLANLAKPWSIAAYAAGFAAGNVIGMTLERVLLPGYSLLRIYSAGRGTRLAETLRGLGSGVTEVPARGLAGTVDLLFTFVRKRHVRRVRRHVLAADPQAVITVENVRSLVGGWSP